MEHSTFSGHHINYFKGELSRGFKALFFSRVFSDVAGGLFAIFLPIFLFNLFSGSIAYLAGYYLASYVVYLFLLMFFLPYLNRLGFRKLLQMSFLFAVSYYGSLMFINEKNIFYMLPLVIFFISFWRVFYWTPYNIDMAKFTNKKDRAKELSLIDAVFSATKIITPILSGFIIAQFGFNILFLVGVIFFVFSSFPLAIIPRTKEKFSWTRKKTLKMVLAQENRQAMAFFFADGAEFVVGTIVWPIFIFELLKGSYLQVGAISTLIIAVTIGMQLIAGKYTDSINWKEKIMKYGGAFYALGWILKIFILTAFHIFIVDAFHKFTQVFYRVPLDTFVFEKAKAQKHLIDEFNIFRQVAINFGRIFMGGIIMISSFYVPLNWLFIFGAIFSIFLSLAHSRLKMSLAK